MLLAIIASLVVIFVFILALSAFAPAPGEVASKQISQPAFGLVFWLLLSLLAGMIVSEVIKVSIGAVQ